MKRFLLVMTAAAGLVGSLATAQAQQNNSSTTANANTTVIQAISISRTAHMNFGSVVAGGSLGTVVLPASASPTRSATGGTTLGSATVVSAAIFAISGEPNNTYAITLPSSPVTITDGTNNMTVSNFTSSPGGTGTLNGSGLETVYVGGTLNVAANQVSGIYSGSFSVTVTYN